MLLQPHSRQLLQLVPPLRQSAHLHPLPLRPQLQQLATAEDTPAAPTAIDAATESAPATATIAPAAQALKKRTPFTVSVLIRSSFLRSYFRMQAAIRRHPLSPLFDLPIPPGSWCKNHRL